MGRELQRSLFISLFLSLLLVLSACTAGTREPSIVSVSGQSTLNVEPDRAVFYSSIQTLKNTAEEAQEENKKISEDVIGALLLAGLDRDAVETSSYTVYRREDWTEKGPVFKGYQADHTLKVTAEDIEKIGRYIDIAVKNGATSIQSVNFELSDEKKRATFNKALETAGSEAREKAEILARSVGGKVGKIVKVSESATNYYPIPVYSDLAVAESGKAAEVPIQPQTLEVTAQVTAEYEIR